MDLAYMKLISRTLTGFSIHKWSHKDWVHNQFSSLQLRFLWFRPDDLMPLNHKRLCFCISHNHWDIHRFYQRTVCHFKLEKYTQIQRATRTITTAPCLVASSNAANS
jgi:hypothetical protein